MRKVVYGMIKAITKGDMCERTRKTIYITIKKYTEREASKVGWERIHWEIYFTEFCRLIVDKFKLLKGECFAYLIIVRFIGKVM